MTYNIQHEKLHQGKKIKDIWKLSNNAKINIAMDKLAARGKRYQELKKMIFYNSIFEEPQQEI